MTTRTACTLGPIAFDVYSEPQLGTLLAREFPDANTRRQPSIIFYIGQQNDVGQSDFIRFHNETADFEISLSDPIVVLIKQRPTRKMRMAHNLPQAMQRLLNQKYLTAPELQYVHLLYGAFLWIIFFAAVRRSKLILHASAFQLDERCVLLCGKGGVGKTDVSAQIILSGNASFVSDDLAPVDGNLVYRNPMFIHVYPGSPIEPALKRPAGIMDAAHWKFRKAVFGSRDVCRRISLTQAYGGLADKAGPFRVSDIVWMTRTQNQEVNDDDAAGLFVADHLDVLRREMKSAFVLSERIGELAAFEQRVTERIAALAGSVNVMRFTKDERSSLADTAQSLQRMLGARFPRGHTATARETFL